MSRYTHEGELTESGAVPTHIYCCTQCGAAVISQWIHDKWHEEQAKTQRLAGGLNQIKDIDPLEFQLAREAEMVRKAQAEKQKPVYRSSWGF